MSGSFSGALDGTTARRKPSGPPRPTGGVSGGPGAARHRGRPRRDHDVGRDRDPGAPTREPSPARGRRRVRDRGTPPATTVCTSYLANGRARASAAPRAPAASRPLSRPCAERRGGGARRATSACTSTSNGRCPSSTGATTEPGVPGRRSARNSADGSGTPSSPAPVIANRPSSSVDPKRCLTARSSRRAWWRSPSNDSTVSTRCSRPVGRPARRPS